MFALFFSLYIAMFSGNWVYYNYTQIYQSIETPLNQIGRLITSIFGDSNHTITDFGSSVFVMDWLGLASFILALITSIGIVVMAVKGVKKAFGIFFMGIRR